MKYCFAAILSLLILFSVFSCKPDDEILTRDANAKLEFSTDTIFFDTVFVSTGSVSKRLKIYNRDSKAVKIDEIKLEKLGASDYDLIIDGQAKDFTSGITLRGNDSLLILVKVFIDPTNSDKPFFIEDQITFQTNGNLQKVALLAFGQNANFFRDQEVTCNETWSGPKAFVLYGDVIVKENCTLTILPGTRIYAHAGASLFVLGTLKVLGNNGKRVFFQNDRRDSTFANVAGQWNGIFLLDKSRDNEIRYAEIKNSVFGLNINNRNGNQTRIENSVIKNCFTAGILGVISNIKVQNTLIANCGQYAVIGVGGGNYDLNYCTIANYNTPSFDRKTESVAFTDTVDLGQGGGIVISPTVVNMRNSIVWGGKLQNEMVFLTGSSSQINISNSLLQTTSTKFSGTGNILNQDPRFIRPDVGAVPASKIDYSLKDDSPAIGAAVFDPNLSIDLRDEGRPQGAANPDMGAYESKK
jgi:hypothetical protein